MPRNCCGVEAELSPASSKHSFLAHFRFPACPSRHIWNVAQIFFYRFYCFNCAKVGCIVNKKCPLSSHIGYSKFTLVGIALHGVIGPSDLICIRWASAKTNYFLLTHSLGTRSKICLRLKVILIRPKILGLFDLSIGQFQGWWQKLVNGF